MKNLAFVISVLLITVPLSSTNPETSEKKDIRPRSEQSLNVISYNLWGLPLWVPKVGINNRFEKACLELKKDQADIVCLQECFSKRL